jgi:hypothetical protein
MSRAFGPVECALSLALIALATWGAAQTLLRVAAAPEWLRPMASDVWT